ncbi:hypothetical protein BDW72DRAFT_112277 [Aspergillus terricola var. indicus]
MPASPNLQPKTAASPKNKPKAKASPPQVKCTYPNCDFWFRTEKDMKKHKTASSEHEYCNKCDIDFGTEEHLLIHKIKSNKHIVCPICGIDFGSEGGRDRHIRQFHRSAQSLTCSGCKSTYRSAAGLMHHIENGECAKIRPDLLLVEQQKKLMRKEALEVFIAPAVPSLVDMGEDDDGGVQLPMTRSEINREAMANQPDSITAKNTNGLIDRPWPKLRETGLEDEMSDLMNFSTVTGNGKKNGRNKEIKPGWVSKGRNHTFSGLPSAIASASASEAGAGAESKAESGAPAASALGPLPSIRISNAGAELARIYKDWNPGNFIDGFTGEYVCACGKRFLTKEVFEKHVLTESQGARRMQCPNCLKIFKSTAAIIAHWESPSLKCDLSEANMYAQIVDEVSGGMIQIAGYNEDGTIRYEASSLELHKTKTTGVDLDEIDW